MAGVVTGFSATMWAMMLPAPLVVAGGCGIAMQLMLGIRSSSRVLEVQRARYLTKLMLHTQPTDNIAGREDYTNMTEAVEGTPMIQLELETAVSKYNIEVVDPLPEETRPRIGPALKKTLAVPLPTGEFDEKSALLAALLNCDKVIKHEIVIPRQDEMIIPQIHLIDGEFISRITPPLEEARNMGYRFTAAGTAALLTGVISIIATQQLLHMFYPYPLPGEELEEKNWLKL